MSNKRYEVNTPGVSPVDRDVTKLLYVSTAKYGGDWHSLMHTHACTELFYVVGGMGQFKVAEKLIPVSPDDLVIVNPNVEHTEVSLNASPLEYIVLGVEGMEFAADENGDRRYSAFNFHSGREDILPYLRGMLREIEQKSAGYEVVCQDLLEILVVKLMRHTDFSLTVTPAQQSSKECAEARRYIDSNFKENISLDQLAELTAGLADLEQIEFHVSRALEDGGLQAEAARVRALAEASLRAGRDTLVYTSRKRMDVAGLDKEQQLKLSVDISNAVTSVVAELGIQPAFIVAKGGITSSDIGVRALRVRRALVMGQIAPGVPVWRTDGESKFPYMPYVIFPGNVGDRTTLLQVVRRLRGE